MDWDFSFKQSLSVLEFHFEAGVTSCSHILGLFLFLIPIRNTVDKNPRWCCTYLLNPSDPLFVEIGEAFIRQQVKGMTGF
jgi:hypothetical protein